MKLHWSTRSPFVRKVMIAAHEIGCVDKLTLQRSVVAMSAPNPDVMRDNPLSRIPTLVLDDGTVFTDSLLIIEYLDATFGSGSIVPASGPDRFEVLRRHALASGFIEVSVLRRNERDRPADKRSEPHLASYALKTKATLASFEASAPELNRRPFDVAQIALAAALGYLDFRFTDEPWRPAHPNLARWHDGVASRPSYQLTMPIDG
jgi:glutathione S-transferase